MEETGSGVEEGVAGGAEEGPGAALVEEPNLELNMGLVFNRASTRLESSNETNAGQNTHHGE
jgi:hypothetical protein